MTAKYRSQHTATTRIKAYRLFFPAAMLHAAIILPLALVAMSTGSPAGLASGPAHGGEMLAGYALVVMAGFLLPPLTMPQAVLLLAAWLAGRIAVVASLSAAWVIIPNVLFATSMALLVVPRFTGVARKWRNQATAPLVALIAATVSAAVALVALHDVAAARPMLYTAVTLLAALLLFMGGRVTAPVIIGTLNRRRQPVNARMQPRIEGAIVLVFIPTIAAQASSLSRPAAAIGAILIGLLGLLRLARWTPWRCGWRGDVWGLVAGYAWVCIGLVLLGSGWLGADLAPILGLHVITVGGLGTLSLNVMARTWLVRAKVDPGNVPTLAIGSALVALATGLRAMAITTSIFTLNQLAAGIWSLAFIIVLGRLLRLEKHARTK